MATQQVFQQVKVSQVVPIKVGMFGPQGSGKSTSAALLAAALSAQFYSRAPVMVVDPEAAWQFLKRRIFDAEGVELIQRPDRTFKGMVASMREAEKLGVCAWIVDPLTLMWVELMESFKSRKGYIAIDTWGDIKQVWGEYIQLFLNTPMSCIANGRLGNEMEEIQDEEHEGRTRLVKTGVKFKAGGGESFGYEPHLLLELSLERKAKRRAGVQAEGEGRMVHRVDVLKDRTWALNGKVLRWSDKPRYEKGGYRTVWDSLKPHWEEVQATMKMVTIAPGSSQDLVTSNGNSEYYERRKQRDTLVAELLATLDLLWGGRGQAEVRIRMRVGEALFGVRSKEALEQLELAKVERGVRILQAFEKRIKADGMPTNEDGVLASLTIDINEFDQGVAEAAEMPF